MKAWEWINRIAAVVTILGFSGLQLLRHISTWTTAEDAPDWLKAVLTNPLVAFVLAHSGWVFAIASLALLLIGLMELYRRYKRQKTSWLLISAIYNQIHEQYKVMLSAIMTQKTYADPQAQAESQARMVLHLRDFFENTLRQMAEVFTTYTGQECRTCFKYYDPDAQEVRAGHRCAKSQRERELHDQKELKRFHIDRNTAFHAIITDTDHAYFAAGNLKKLSRRGGYKNLNKSWPKFYNSTVVVPISASTDPREINGQNVYGFFCVDSLKADLDDQIIINMMKQIAVIYYLLFAHLNVGAFQQPPPAAATS